MKLKQYKTARRLGARIFPKTQNPKFVLTKPFKRKKHPSPITEYGLQMLEKQKMRYTYNLNERQFASYVKRAISKKGVKPAEYLHQMLERRLDNVVFRLGLASTRPLARQMVSHGHIVVNGRKVTIPSFSVSLGDKIGVRSESKDKKLYTNLEEALETHVVPAWLSLDAKKIVGTVTALPSLDTSSEDVFNLTSVVEFYSR